MAATLETFRDNLQKLIRKFEADTAHYLSKDYSEAQARIDFINPFFKALGWDVDNEQGLLHHQRECLVEKGAEEGRPDYSFRLGGQTKFFVEAKAPCHSLEDPRHIVQAKGYAWNTREVFFVILTDFEEFRFYDASIQPDERKPEEGLLRKLKHTEYLKRAGELWDFSKERVAAGSLEALLPRDRRTQRLRIPVDKRFLEEMTGWREDLARNVLKNNPGLTARQLNEVVQRLPDRIVFIRIAEDRHIIEKRQLAELSSSALPKTATSSRSASLPTPWTNGRRGAASSTSSSGSTICSTASTRTSTEKSSNPISPRASRLTRKYWPASSSACTRLGVPIALM